MYSTIQFYNNITINTKIELNNRIRMKGEKKEIKKKENIDIYYLQGCKMEIYNIMIVYNGI